jgi:hypothetical protein
MTEEQAHYLRQLIRSLESAGIPGRRIGDLTAEIAAHLADAQTDPLAEFGTPSELADSLADDERGLPKWLRSLPARLAGVTLIMAAADVILAGILNRNVTAGSLGRAIGIGVLTIALRHGMGRRLDGRSMWSAVTPSTIAVAFGGAALLALPTPIDVVIGSPSPVMALGIAAPLAAAGILVLWLAEGRIRFPEGSEHLESLLRVAAPTV